MRKITHWWRWHVRAVHLHEPVVRILERWVKPRHEWLITSTPAHWHHEPRWVRTIVRQSRRWPRVWLVQTSSLALSSTHLLKRHYLLTSKVIFVLITVVFRCFLGRLLRNVQRLHLVVLPLAKGKAWGLPLFFNLDCLRFGVRFGRYLRQY